MIPPPLEVADIVRTYGTAFVKQHRGWLTALHLKVLRAIVACRTAALGVVFTFASPPGSLGLEQRTVRPLGSKVSCPFISAGLCFSPFCQGSIWSRFSLGEEIRDLFISTHNFGTTTRDAA
jgi:hypothetical protein